MLYAKLMEIELINCSSITIISQLELEKRLLSQQGNYLLINSAPSGSTVVMGISSTQEDIHLLQAKAANIDIIKRFSGGGTVLIDEHCIMITFICNADTTTAALPHAISTWVITFYQNALQLDLQLIENDFVLDNKKIGGSAQYIKKERWLHHSVFPYSYSPNMNCLKMPLKQPSYRQQRNHALFIKTIDSIMPRELFIEKLVTYLATNFTLARNQTVDTLAL